MREEKRREENDGQRKWERVRRMGRKGYRARWMESERYMQGAQQTLVFIRAVSANPSKGCPNLVPPSWSRF